MTVPAKITIPEYPRFLTTLDMDADELYITCTNPPALLWVRQTTPVQICMVNGPLDEDLLSDCAEWYNTFILKYQNNESIWKKFSFRSMFR
jgi:hypothetical protein